MRVVGGAVRQRPLLHAMSERIDDRRVERLVTVDRPAQLAEDRLGQVLALRPLVEDVLAVDVGPGVGEVVLGLGDPVLGDLRDRRMSSSHGSPVVGTGWIDDPCLPAGLAPARHARTRASRSFGRA